jgi:hypothetical protein
MNKAQSKSLTKPSLKKPMPAKDKKLPSISNIPKKNDNSSRKKSKLTSVRQETNANSKKS